jgi:hypothetical protein
MAHWSSIHAAATTFPFAAVYFARGRHGFEAGTKPCYRERSDARVAAALRQPGEQGPGPTPAQNRQAEDASSIRAGVKSARRAASATTLAPNSERRNCALPPEMTSNAQRITESWQPQTPLFRYRGALRDSLGCRAPRHPSCRRPYRKFALRGGGRILVRTWP